MVLAIRTANIYTAGLPLFAGLALFCLDSLSAAFIILVKILLFVVINTLNHTVSPVFGTRAMTQICDMSSSVWTHRHCGYSRMWLQFSKDTGRQGPTFMNVADIRDGSFTFILTCPRVTSSDKTFIFMKHLCETPVCLLLFPSCPVLPPAGL